MFPPAEAWAVSGHLARQLADIGRCPAMGQLLVTSWALPGEGADAIRGTVAELRGPARPGLHGADGRGWPAHCGCRKVPGTRLASGTPTSDTQKPDSPSQGQNVPAPRATHPLPVTTSLLRNAHGHVARQPDASMLLSFSRLPAAPVQPVDQRPLPPSSADALSELLREAVGPSEPSRATRDLGRSWGAVLASAYKEPHLTCSPWSPRDTPGVGTRVHPIYQWGD